MNKNRVVPLLAILLFTLSVEMLGTETNYVAANSSPSISITPTASKILLYSSLNVSLSISEVTDLYLWVVTIEWSSTILNLLDYSEGPFLQQGGETTFLSGEVTAGRIEGLTCSLLGSVPGVNGSGTLATFQFNTTATGTTSINITFSDLLDSEGSSIAHSVVNGTAEVIVREEMPIIGGENATVEGNVDIANADATENTLNFDVSGPSGSTGWINVTFPMVNTTEIKVFVDGVKLIPPPFPIITTNGTHYFIYFEFTLSTHTVTIQFGPTLPVGGIYIPVNKLELLAPHIGLTVLLAVAVVTVVFLKHKKDKY